MPSAARSLSLTALHLPGVGRAGSLRLTVTRFWGKLAAMLFYAAWIIQSCPVPVSNLMAATAAVRRRITSTGAGRLARTA